MSDLLQVHGLCKGYPSGTGRIEVLVDLNIALRAGEMMAVTGVSGSGKSTLLHLIGGMDRPDRGSILIQGLEITTLTLPELSRFRNHTVGFVFQFHHILPEFTALENVMMPLLLRGEAPESARERSRTALADVHMSDRLHHRPGELSGGEQQRVAIARALVGRPRLLLADEPTGDLDPNTGAAIGQLLQDLHRQHDLTSILVTHNEKLASLCTRSCRLEDGKLNESA
jgi:lipoprotein-releasing system ATP-binding protein